VFPDERKQKARVVHTRDTTLQTIADPQTAGDVTVKSNSQTTTTDVVTNSQSTGAVMDSQNTGVDTASNQTTAMVISETTGVSNSEKKRVWSPILTKLQV